LGLEPRFEAGDIVARGFADLGFEEFQVLPGPQLLSLTAGTTKPLSDDHRHHFFWIPSVDEAVAIIEQQGVMLSECVREDARNWRISAQMRSDASVEVIARSLHEALLRTLLAVYSKLGSQ